MARLWGVHAEFSVAVLFEQERLQLTGVDAGHGLSELVVGAHQVSAVITADEAYRPPEGLDSAQGLDKGARGESVGHFQMNGSGSKAGEHYAVSFYFLSFLFHNKWAEKVHSTIREG